MDSLYKFTPGQHFVLKPNARIIWLCFSNHDGSCVGAVRTDSEIGKKLEDWLFAGADRNNKPCTYTEVTEAMREFWPHDLEHAELS